MRLSGKTILISGSGSGLGAATAQRLLAQGANVVGLDLAADPAWVPVWNGPENWQGRYMHAQADVTQESSVQHVVQEGVAKFGRLSGVVCCAGILHGERVLGPSGLASLDAFRRVIDVNLVGTIQVVRAAVQAIAQGELQQPDQEQGVVVMTSSIAAFDGQIGQCAYSASKGAIAAMTLPMAREFARFGIRVVSIAPGVFQTPMMQAASQKVRGPLLDASVFPKRFGLPEEFASMVQSVLENSMLNGTIIRLDGAMRM